MKKPILILFLFLTATSIAQLKEIVSPFSKLDIGFYGGINFINTSKIGSTFFLEGKTNLSSKVNLKLSIGYKKNILDNKYEIKSFRTIYSDMGKSYQTYKMTEQYNYKIIPIAIGAEYAFFQKSFTTYALFEVGYNAVRGIYKYGGNIELDTYDSIDKIPHDHIVHFVESRPTESVNVGLGVGIKYPILNEIYLDLRYIHQYHDNMNNSNEFLIGINF